MKTIGYYMGERVQVFGEAYAKRLRLHVGFHDEEAGEPVTVFRFTRDVLMLDEHRNATAYRCADVASAQRVLEKVRQLANLNRVAKIHNEHTGGTARRFVTLQLEHERRELLNAKEEV